MGTFDDLKTKALEAVDVIADVSVDLYKKAEAKTKELARSAKLQADIASDRTSIKRLYMQIGRTYYETHKMFPAEEFEQNVTEITALFDRIAERQAELEELRAKGNDVEDDAEVESVYVDDAADDEACDCGCEEHKTDDAE